ncbi:hypothetical protein BC829DRAFT_128116 [Chytridium lagenaria]|nr:hypothetical protein BC829DRAFT_128116 [Chytridium lagenaria]
MAKVVTAPAAHLLNRNGPLDEATAAQTSRVTKAPKRGEKSRKEPKKVAAVKKGKDSGMVNVLVPAYEGRFSPGTEPSPPPSESQQSTASSLADSLDDAGVALDRSSIFSDFIEASGSLSSEDTGLLMEALNSIAESVPGTSWTESDGLFSKDFALQNPTPQATTPGLSPTRNLIRLPAESPHIHLPPQLAYSSVNPFKTGKLQKAPPKLKTARSHTGPLTPPIDPAQMKMFHGAAPSLAPPMPVPPMRKLQVKRNSIGDPANAMDVSISLPKEPGVSMRPKVYVHKACINCKVSHVACDVGRPCSRCVRLGKADTCVDAERKKRGRPCNSVKKAMLEAQAAKEAEALAASGGIVPEKPSVPPNPAGWVLAHPSDTAALPAEPPTKKQKTKNPRALEILAGPPRITPEPLSSDQTMSLSSDIPMNESTPSLNSSVEPESTDLKANPMDLVEGSNPLLTIQALQSLGVSISLAEVSQEMVRQLIESGELHTPEDILQAITAISTLLPEDSVGTASGIGFTCKCVLFIN